MTFTGEPTVEEEPCGCRTITYPVISQGTRTEVGPIVKYEPCLPCALANAGLMLQQAAERMREAQAGEAEEAAEQAELQRILAEDSIGGSD
jgi:hypothetical protein